MVVFVTMLDEFHQLVPASNHTLQVGDRARRLSVLVEDYGGGFVIKLVPEFRVQAAQGRGCLVTQVRVGIDRCRRGADLGQASSRPADAFTPTLQQRHQFLIVGVEALGGYHPADGRCLPNC